MKLTATFALSALLVVLVAGPSPAQQPAKPKALRPLVIVYNGQLSSLLNSLAESYDVVIGFEQDSRAPVRAVNISVKEALVRDALDAIVKNRPEYQWREANGAFEVLPVGPSSPLLDTKIMRFQVSGSTWTNAMDILMALQEMQQAMSTLQIGRADPTPSLQVGDSFSLQLENVTFRQVLNEMTRKSGRHFWHYSERGVKPKTFVISN